MMELVTRAIIFAAKAHDGTRHKKSAVPYILHPMDAAAIVGSLTDKQEIPANCTHHLEVLLPRIDTLSF